MSRFFFFPVISVCYVVNYRNTLIDLLFTLQCFAFSSSETLKYSYPSRR